MVYYKVVFIRSASRELEKLPSQISNRILQKIELLEKEPRPKGCKKLQSPENLWRIRVGDYRIIYSISDKKRQIKIWIIRHRSDAYR